MAGPGTFPLPCSLEAEGGIPEAAITILHATAPDIRVKTPQEQVLHECLPLGLGKGTATLPDVSPCFFSNCLVSAFVRGRIWP